MTAKKAVETITKQKFGSPQSSKSSQPPSIAAPSSVNTTTLSKQRRLPDFSTDSNPTALPRSRSFRSQASTRSTSAKNVSTTPSAQPPVPEVTASDSKKSSITPEQKPTISPRKDESKVGTATPVGSRVSKIDSPGKQDRATTRLQAPQAKQSRSRPGPTTPGTSSNRKK